MIYKTDVNEEFSNWDQLDNEQKKIIRRVTLIDRIFGAIFGCLYLIRVKCYLMYVSYILLIGVIGKLIHDTNPKISLIFIIIIHLIYSVIIITKGHKRAFNNSPSRFKKAITPRKGKDIIKQIIMNKKNIGKEIEIDGNKIKIQKNIKIGDTINVIGKGEKGYLGGDNGDLFYVIINIK